MRVVFLSLTFAVFFVLVSACGTSPTYSQDSNFVRIEGGTFLMGCDTCCWSNASPVRNVTVSCFYMSRYVVTQGEWYDMLGTNPSRIQGTELATGVNWRNLPVVRVSWFDAVEFANHKSQRAGLIPAYTITGIGYNRIVTWNRNANGYRLPTEAEWECVDKARKTAIMTTKCPASTQGMIS